MGSRTREVEQKPVRRGAEEQVTGDRPDQADGRRGGAALSLSDAIVQAKLTVGPAVDPYEREADRVADRVVRSLNGSSSASEAESVEGETESVAQRVQRASTTVGAAGGAVDADTDREIRSSRGGGKAMPKDARRKMEGAFGADFGGVRIHEGAKAAELSDRIQAKAFTVGRDVYFRDGMPDTNSTAGQHLLAHELTHTIQQGGAVARSTDTTDAPATTVRRAPETVQRLMGVVPFGAFTYEASATAVLKAKKKKLIPAGAKVDVDDSDVRPSDDDPDSGWAKVTTVTAAPGTAVGDAPAAAPAKTSWWKRKTKKTSGAGAPPTVEASPLGWFPLAAISAGSADPDALETAGEAISPLGMMGDVADDLGADGGKQLKGNQENQLNMAGGVGGAASGLIGLAAAIKSFREAETNGDRVDSVVDVVDNVAGASSGIAGAVKAGKDAQKGSAASDAAGGLGMFASIFSGIKSTYELVKEAVNLAKDAQKMTGQEKTESIMAMISSLLEAASSGVAAAKTFLDTFAGGASEALKNSVPGFGIALGTVDIIVRAVALVKGLVQKGRMRKDKQGKKAGLAIEMPDGRIVHGEKGKKFEAATLYRKLCKKRDNLQPGQTLPTKDEEFLARCDQNEDFQHYLFSKGLQWINQKRANRAILKMSVAMTQIAGDVATLGGASAPVGVGLKAGAMALDVGASIFRKQKQYFRDMRARKEAAGQNVNGFLNMYDSKKSSARKIKQYNKMVDRIFDMIVRSAAMPPPAPGAKDLRFVQVQKYLDAVGISMTRVKSFQNDPAGLRSTMIEYLQKRE